MTASSPVSTNAGLDAPEPFLTLLGALARSGRVDPAVSSLVDEAVAVWRRPGFDTLLSAGHLSFEPFDYQRATAHNVLRRMRGRAILADEVGLGKTIEAGLVLAELRMRQLAGRSLVVTPAGLVEQWREELERKFAIPTVIPSAKSDPAEVSAGGVVVLASLAAARRDPLKSLLTSQPWDLVVADEAHRLRNPRAASGRFARALTSRYLLLLTATPVENKLSDLYELVSLVAPGLLGTPAQFKARHGAGDGSSPRDIAGLRALTRTVMVRHRRSEVALLLPQRLASTKLIVPDPDERDFYTSLTSRIREAARGAGPASPMALRSAARLAGSTPAAAAPTLTKLGWRDLAAQSAAITAPAKLRAAIDLLSAHVAAGEKVLVFTAFRQTLDAVAEAAARAGLPHAVYHGSLTRAEKEQAVASFAADTPLLLSTESAGEGRNLQFCHVMVNLDLPWNPMQIEQRLGRLHRIGQEHDVLLTNLVAAGTIEQRILRVLEAKINLFELVVGELDMILGRVDDEFDFESAVFDAFTSAEDDAAFTTRLNELGEQLAAARTGYLATRDTADALIAAEED